MRRLSAILVACFVIVLTARSAGAQPFFGGGVVAFNPEISVVSSGTLVDAQPVVSQDMKYVTINMQAQQSSLLALRTFQVNSVGPIAPAQGFVGGVNPAPAANPGVGANPGARANSTAPLPGAPSSSPQEIERRAIAARSVLERRGMFLLRAD